MATNFTSVLSPVSPNFSHRKSLHPYKPFGAEEDVYCVTDMGLKHRRSFAALFLSSQSEDSDSSMEAPESPVQISPARKRTLSYGSVFYDDLSSSNISALSVETSIPDTSLLDNDPFADLTVSPVQTMGTLIPPAPHVKAGPKSPLSAPSSPSRDVPWFRTTLTTSPTLPAHKRPAFRNSPSLPSLSTLANLDIKIPRKVRKGNVGAGLPSEPWNLTNDDESKDTTSFTTSSDTENSIVETSSEEEEEYGEPCTSTLNIVAERLGDRLSDEFELPGIKRILPSRCPHPSSPTSRTSGDVNKEHSRASSSYEFEANDWFPQPWQTSVDLTDLPPLSFPYSTQVTSKSPSSSNHSHTLPLETSLIHPLIIANEKTSSHNSTEAINGHSTEEEFSALNCSPCQVATDRGMPANLHSSIFPFYERAEEAINVNLFRDSDPSPYEATQSGSSPKITPSTTCALPSDKNSYSASSSRGNSHRRMSVTAEMWIQGGVIGVSAESIVDGGEYQRGQSTNGADWSSGYGSGGAGGGAGSQRGRGHSSGGYSGSGYGAGSGSGGDDGDGGRRNNRFLPGSSFSASPDNSEEEEEDNDESDDYGQPSALAPTAESDDDDVPLARSIPTALKAQQSIRLKDREDRDKRRKEREIRAAARQQQAVIRSSSTQQASLPASRSMRRPATAPIQSIPPPYGVDDLTQRLENVQPISRSNLRSADGPKSVSPPQDLAPSRSLRPMRSFHKPEPRMTREDWNAPPLPLPTAADPKVTRSNTRARARSTTSREESVTSQSRAPQQTVAVDTTQKLERKRTSKPVEGTKSARTSSDKRPTALPAPAELARQLNAKIVSQQRIFIGDRQRFVVVEVNPATSAGDVTRMVEAQGALKEWRGSGGWMLFEIAQDFGMERPVRSFELLSDVEASWNKAKTVNVFLMKLTTLAPVLSRSALPTSSPTHSGYVEWESKRGKWNKRYLMLKSHCLWLSKRDNGRDEELVCSLSNFDAYQITRLVKAPKDFTFAVKSTDNLSFFENTADYLHIFSCKTDAGEKWMEKILLARSYVLHQERNVLFQSSTKTHPKSPPPQVESNLSRSLTKRAATQPLVNVNPGNLFEPGTLLHR